MARVAPKDLQTLVRSRIEGDAWFAEVSIFADSGVQAGEIQSAVAESGFVVVVGPVERVVRLDHARGTALARAHFTVEIWENPAINPVRLNKNPLEAVSRIINVVTLLDSGFGEPPAEPESELASLYVDDAGVRGYLVPLSKIVQIF